MLLFGHLGTTVGTARITHRLINVLSKDKQKLSIDYRLVMLGSMLPDVIDKPLVLMTATKPVGAARYIAHSLIFVAALSIIGKLYKLMFKKNEILILGLASAAHLLEDLAWRSPRKFFWPYYNLVASVLKKSHPTVSIIGINKRVEIIVKSVERVDFKKLLLKPEILVPEVIGALIILGLLLKLILNKRLLQFIKSGKL